MNFTLLFAIVGDLSFVIDFNIIPGETQDFLFFEGINDSAHLYRQNNTVLLHVNTEIYRANIENKLEFSWDKFRINGTEMEKIKSSGIDRVPEFDAFTFLSPALNHQEYREEKIINSILSTDKVNYYYIFVIVILSVLLVDSKPRTFRIIRDILLRQKESDYEVMSKINEQNSRESTI